MIQTEKEYTVGEHSSLVDSEFGLSGTFSHLTLESTIDANVDPRNLMSNSYFPTFAHEAAHFYQTVGTANGIRLVALQNGIIQQSLEAIERTCNSDSGSLPLPLLPWLGSKFAPGWANHIHEEITALECTSDYLRGYNPPPHVLSVTPTNVGLFGHYPKPGFAPVPSRRTQVELRMFTSQYAHSSRCIHQPFGATLLREGVSQLIQDFFAHFLELKDKENFNEVLAGQFNSTMLGMLKSTLQKRAHTEDWHPYYAVFNLYRTLITPKYKNPVTFLVLSEIALMSDFVVANHEVLNNATPYWNNEKIWEGDTLPGLTFVRLMHALRDTKPPIRPPDITQAGDSLRFANEVATAAGMPNLTEMRQKTLRFIDNYPLLKGPFMQIGDAAKKCLELQVAAKEPLFLLLRSHKLFDFIGAIQPPIVFHNLMMNPAFNNWAMPCIIHQVLHRSQIQCPIDRDGKTEMCHVLKEGKNCLNLFPEELQLSDEHKFHEDCLYFITIQFMKEELGIRSLFRTNLH